MLLISFMSTCLLNCKKNTDDPKPDCKIVAITAGTTTNTFTYNADGKLSSHKNGDLTNKFIYNGNTITITNIKASVIDNISIVTLNADGLAFNVNLTDTNGTILNNTFYEYDGIELNKSITTGSGGLTDTTTYTRNDGNLVSFHVGSLTVISNYSTNKAAQT